MWFQFPYHGLLTWASRVLFIPAWKMTVTWLARQRACASLRFRCLRGPLILPERVSYLHLYININIYISSQSDWHSRVASLIYSSLLIIINQSIRICCRELWYKICSVDSLSNSPPVTQSLPTIDRHAAPQQSNELKMLMNLKRTGHLRTHSLKPVAASGIS